jgi:ferredoxin-thioredoxin reductase catalytic chain
MTAEELHETLRKLQEPKGYFFNRNRELVLDLLNGLLANRERYGYMCCPCRLASGNREWDKDIVCPCAYREEDVREYGRCFCGLYTSPSLDGDDQDSPAVPERRPPEKIRF